MKQFLVLWAVAVAGLSVASPVTAQDLAPLGARSARVVRPGPGGILTAPSTASHGAIVADFLQTRGADANTAASLRNAGERRDGGEYEGREVQLRLRGGLQRRLNRSYAIPAQTLRKETRCMMPIATVFPDFERKT